MKIVFYSHDDAIEEMLKSLGGELFFARDDQRVMEILEDVDEDEDCLLFLDMDIGAKPVEALNKSLVQNEWLYRIIISSSMKVKDFKKHQKGKTSAHGYVLKPFSASVFKGILSDMEISHLISEGEIFEEGQQLPNLPGEPQSVTGWDEADAHEADGLENGEDDVDFGAQEFKMNTQVRKLVDLHSVKGERPPYEGELNDKIQQKFDLVFGASEVDSFSSSHHQEEGTQESIDLRENADDGPALDLSLGEEATEFTIDATNDAISMESVDEDDFVISNDEDEELDLGVSVEASEESEAANDLGIDLDEEIDLGEELSFDSEEDESIVISEDASSTSEASEMDLDSGESDELDLGDGLDLLSEGSEEAGETEDFSRELDELTANRKLPTKEELSEFEEETGDINLPSEQELSEVEVSASEDDPMAEDNNDNQDTSDGLDFDLGESSDDDILEFDDVSEVEDEGELTFSDTEDEAAPEISTESVDVGEMDFSLGEDEDSSIETAETVEDAGVEIADEQEDSGLEMAGAGDDFDLGEDAVLVAEEAEASGSLDFSMGEDSVDELTTESVEEDPIVESASETDAGESSLSSFSGDELNFDDGDDDDEIEKTMAINVAEIGKNEINLEKAFEDDDEDSELDLGGDLEASSEDGLEEEIEEVEAIEEIEEDSEEIEVAAEDEESLDFDDDDEFSADEDDLGEATNPTMVMTEEMTQDIENMLDEEPVTQEFRPGEVEVDDDNIEVDDDESEIDEVEFADDETVEIDSISEVSEEVDSEPIQAPTKKATSEDSGHLSITAQEDRVPPSFNESEAIRLQATIRQLREEREDLLKEISDLKRDKRLVDQDNLGLKAELDEAKIEISILKKRHGNESDEMKYRLRLSDEKKLFAEEKARKLQKEFDRLQQKVRIDFNQIKQREKELESQLELVKMDSEGQVQSRDKKILDLKRKIDQLEFNMENIVIREQKSRDDKSRVEERLERIMKTLRGSIEVLEDDIDWQDDKRK